MYTSINIHIYICIQTNDYVLAITITISYGNLLQIAFVQYVVTHITVSFSKFKLDYLIP